MSCTNCFNNCPEGPVSDQCVKYTGADNETIGIESGDSLYQVNQALITYLLSFVDGTGITLEELSQDCDFLSDLINEDLSLKNILQAYSDAICSLKSSVTALQPTAYSFDTDCLEDLPESPSQADILQATVTKLCSLESRVEIIEENYVSSSDVTTIVNNIINTNSSSAQEYTKMPKYVALPYHGSLSNFDSSGKGISSAGYDKVYMCIGQTVNGFTLPSYSGRSPIMVNTGIPGTLDSVVDPAQTVNAGYSIALNAKKGAYTHTLSSTENAPHTHTVTDPGHKHWASIPSRDFKNADDSGSDLTSDGDDRRSFQTDSAVTNISINSSGGGQPHNNTHPVVGCVMIMYIP